MPDVDALKHWAPGGSGQEEPRPHSGSKQGWLPALWTGKSSFGTTKNSGNVFLSSHPHPLHTEKFVTDL